MSIRAGAEFAPAFAPVALECATVRDAVLMHSTLLFDILALVRSQYTGDHRHDLLLSDMSVFLLSSCSFGAMIPACPWTTRKVHYHPKAEVLE